MKYLICCNKIVPWTELIHVAEQEDEFLYPKRLVHGTCPTCSKSFSYTGREIVGLSDEDFYFCLACVSYKPLEFDACEPVFRSKRHWQEIKCDCCGETLLAGYSRKNQP